MKPAEGYFVEAVNKFYQRKKTERSYDFFISKIVDQE